MSKQKRQRRKKIQLRIRNKISGNPNRPRLSVFRSNKNIYCQLVDDLNGITLAHADGSKIDVKGTKTDLAAAVGKDIADKAMKLNIDNVVFDRSGYLYHGRVKALADGAREGGLKF